MSVDDILSVLRVFPVRATSDNAYYDPGDSFGDTSFRCAPNAGLRSCASLLNSASRSRYIADRAASGTARVLSSQRTAAKPPPTTVHIACIAAPTAAPSSI